jgi:hypothetical protein
MRFSFLSHLFKADGAIPAAAEKAIELARTISRILDGVDGDEIVGFRTVLV